MEQKINFKKIWWGFTAGFMMLSWIILVYFLRFKLWIMLPVFIGYLFINSLVFYSYTLGMAGNFYYFTRKPEKAMYYYKKAVRHNTSNVKALYNYSLEQLHLGNAEEALKYLERAEKFNNNILYDKYIPLAKGSCYWVLGDIDKGIITLNELQQKYEYVNYNTLTTLGYFYILKGDYDKALDYSNQALRDNAEYAPAWDNIGQIYFNQNLIAEAKEAFLKALEYRETMVDSLYYMGQISEKENNIKEAINYYTRASKCNISAMNTVTLEAIQKRLSALSS